MSVRLLDPAPADLSRLAVLHAAGFADAWTAKAIGDLLATPNCYTFATDEGFILARAAGGEAEILTLAVVPSARNRGLGRALVAAAAAHACKLGAAALFLEVASDNKAALALYDGLGFVRVAERKAYYDRRDALVLKVPLPLPPKAKFA